MTMIQTDEERLRITGNTGRVSATLSNVLGKVLGFATAAVLLVAVFMFSLLVFAFVAAAGLLVLGYLWWKTRDLRRHLRERPPGGHVIEGEAIRDADALDKVQRR